MKARDVPADYKAALLEEFESYKRAGRDDDAAAVAAVLRAQHDHEVEEKPEPKRRGRPPKERADVQHAPERAVPDAPKHPTKSDARGEAHS